MKINHINAAQPYTNYNGSNKTNPFKDNPSFAGKVYMPKLTNIKKELIFSDHQDAEKELKPADYLKN